MERGRDFEPGDVVDLLVEVPAGGRIHEIGTRARVLAALDTALELDVGGESFSCPAGHVVRSGPRRARLRSSWQAATRLRPATA